ncbi:MAG TPA: pyrroloquinoline quinone-dependent dehydrogenase [Woeseiaceae bacterium]|nr:pyrroloquinoline quinone-dependent dehydrogenase [Woeseiaceae bacterium]
MAANSARPLLVAMLVAALSTGAASAAPASPSAEGWPHYGRDAGGTRYSPLTQIDASNLEQLEIIWQFRTGELGQDALQGEKLTFEATPVLWRGTLYFSTGFGTAFAIDAASGRQVWRFDSKVPRDLRFAEITSRGVTVWEDPERDSSAACKARVYLGNIVGRLYALDALTGEPCSDFGEQGVVDLHLDARPRLVGQYAVTSPPAMAGDRVIVGSAIGDNSAVGLERGIVRALDARSGETLWSWDPVPTDPADPAFRTWKSGIEEAGGGNAWPPLSVDAANGLVFVPTGAPSTDFFGGLREGDNAYANSLVALSIQTGEVEWFRQLVHHDVWDYDLPAQPLLVEFEKDGREHSAVVQATKMGMVFVFDRLTGEPIYPIEERPVPQGGIEGETLSPTQPFSSLPPLASHRAITEDDAWGLLYFDKRGCRRKIAALRSEGIYTPPTIGGTLMNPGYAGGSNWGGLAWDPKSQMIIATVLELPMWVRLTPREEAQRQMDEGTYDWEGYTEMDGTPYVLNRGTLLSALEVPCTKPPWGKLVALNLGSGEIEWERPVGTIQDIAPAPVPNIELGVPLIGGAITTASGLIFVAATFDNYLRAFDTATGEELWKGRLPAGGQATPMTYSIDDRQYVVIAAGGHGGAGTTRGDYIVAFALQE